MRPAWKGDPIVRVAHDEVRLLKVVLAFPVGGQAGGEVAFQRYYNGQPVGAPEAVAIDPGQPDALPRAFFDWVVTQITRRGELAGAVLYVPVDDAAPPKPPTPEPGIPLG